ncbi:MAG: hydantoinase B/oxoprolinase family protein, partial [Hyphomicrobiaceae bacterium]
FSHRGERHFVAASGAAGGKAGATAQSYILRTDHTREAIASKVVTPLRPGDRLVIETPGGGGYGEPHERAPRDRTADLANGKVSSAASPDMPIES